MSWTNKEGTRHPSLKPKRDSRGKACKGGPRGAQRRRMNRGKTAFLIGKRRDFHGLKDKGRGEESYETS